MKKILFKTTKNSNIEIIFESNKNYTIKDIKKLIENQYGWDHKKLKIYKDKYDINSLLNDEYPLDQYLKKNNTNNYFYYLKNYRYIQFNIYEGKKDDDSSIEFDFERFCSNESSSNSLPQFNSSKDVNKNTNFIFNENKKPFDSDNIDSNRKSVNFTNNNNIIGINDKNKKNSNVINNNIPKTKNNDNNFNNKNNTNINDNNLKINKTNNENNNKKNESENKTDNNNNNNFHSKFNLIPPKNKIKKTASEEIFTENENQKIEELIDFVGCTRDKAIKALKMAKWDLNEAMNIIFDI